MPNTTKVFEADFNTRFLPLSKKLKRIEDKIYKQMMESVGNAKMSASYWAAQKAQLNKLYVEMNAVFDGWAKKEIPARYRRSLKLVNARIKAAKNVTEIGAKSLSEMMNSNFSIQVMRSLYDDTIQSFISASVGGRANLTRLFLQTQQALLNESLVNATVVTGFQMGNLREAKTMLSNLFKSRAMKTAEGKLFVQAGRYRYKPSYYAELVARSKFHQAHTQAALGQARNYDTDLVEISTHNTTTAICLPFEGKVFSISGKDTRFPPIDEFPPFHPNCLHLMFPTFESGMEAEGTLKAYEAFSNDRIETHPTVRNFIPAGDRVVA